MKKSRLFLIAAIAIILFLVITNPTLKDFKEHIGISNTVAESKMYLQRQRNYFVCSSYTISGEDASYFAIAGNFFRFKGQKQVSREYLKKIYDQLSPSVELNDFDSFVEHLEDQAFRKAVYREAVKKMHLNNYDEYEKRIYLANN